MRPYFWLAPTPCCAALCLVALAAPCVPAFAQENAPAPMNKFPRFAFSVGVYSGGQLFNYAESGVAFRLDYTFFQRPRHEAVVSLLYADVTNTSTPLFSFFGNSG